MNELLSRLRQLASEQGFVDFGVAPAIESAGFNKLVDWIDAGFAGEMNYIQNRRDAYQHPAGVLEGVRTIIALAFPYASPETISVSPGRGKVARYAHSGVDYHDVIHPKLKRICKEIRESVDGATARGVVDTAPLLEREVAQLAGLGWRGKNTLLLNKHRGSYFFLACVLTSLDLPVDTPHQHAHCGTCTACLDACPTDAFPRPGVLNATRCISYLTIEFDGSIDLSLRDGIGDWLFGCDICQEVCPWNRKHSRANQQPGLATDNHQPGAAAQQNAALESIELTGLFRMTDDEFRTRFRKTPLWRTRRRGVLRNAAIVLGNQRCRDAIGVLSKAAEDDPEPVVREAAQWAIRKIQDAETAG